MALPIRARLTLWYTGVLGLTLIVFGVGLYWLLGHALTLSIDRALVEQAAAMQRLVRAGQRFGPPNSLRVPLRPMPDVFIQVATPGQVYLRSWVILQGDEGGPLRGEGIPSPAATLPAPPDDSLEPQFRTVHVDGARMRLHEIPLTAAADGPVWLQVGRPLVEMDQAMATLRWMLLGGGSLALAAAGGVGWWMAGAAMRPIDRITRAAHHIGQHRDWQRRVDYTGPKDEIGHMAETINEMLDELEEAFTRLESAFQSQRHLLAAASHQLRTPLTIIRGNVELVQRMGGQDPEAQREALADVAAEAARLTQLVGDLMTLARADAGQQLDREPAALYTTLRSAFDHIRPVAGTRNLVWSVMDAEVVVLGHPTFLEQLFMILLENAIRYTEEDGEIRVGCQRDEGVATVWVQDNGMGIAPEDLPHIFDRFYRSPRAKNRPGSGLGLAIAQWIAEQHGVSIAAASQLGKGTTFTLRFPIMPEGDPHVGSEPVAS